MSAVGRFDRFQRRHTSLGFPLAVMYKYFDDRGSYLAALVTYYAFVSLFPLLLLFYTVLGFLPAHSAARHDLQESVLKNFPVIGHKLSQSIGSFHGNGLALAVGILGTLYGGLGAMQAAQAGFNQIYGVPRNEQPNPIKSRVRSLGLLVLLGAGVLITTALAVILATANGIASQLGPSVHVAGYILTYAVNAAMFIVAFQLLTAEELRFRQVMAGGMVAAALWMLVETFGSSYVGHLLTHSEHLYGLFAAALVILAWLYLQSVILMLSAEINVVLHRHLWPRSLLTPFTDNVQLTRADRRAYRQYAQTQRFKGFERVTAEFDAAPRSAPAGSAPDGQAPEEEAGPEPSPGVSPEDAVGNQPGA